MEQSPILGPIFHGRVIGLSTVLFLLDYLFIVSAYTHTISRGASVQIVFGFEVTTNLFFSSFHSVEKYIDLI
jgi:E3 ubiquitin-protein ligase synoviolin